MTIRFFDPRKLEGRTGARALIFVLGVLLSQWVAIGAMLGMIWLQVKTAGNVDASVSCSFVIFSSLLFTWLLFSKKGLKTQRRAASSFEKFVSSLLKPRIFNKSAPFNNLHSDTNGSLGLSEGPYPPPPRNSLA
ncbi:hypothetical protein [Limnobacter sp.]|uniref:hypothetical protein n=1 Tax=Limnobacter sp. TaxID=2003368 RepID=UPI0025BD5200|nr:hypothetical protein [Limnobacter sp.]